MSDYKSVLVTPRELERLIHAVDINLYDTQFILKELLSVDCKDKHAISIYQEQLIELTALSNQLRTAK